MKNVSLSFYLFALLAFVAVLVVFATYLGFTVGWQVVPGLLFHLRVALIAAVLLVAFPAFALSAGRPMLANIFEQPNESDLALVISTAFAASFAVLKVSLFVLDRAPERFGYTPVPLPFLKGLYEQVIWAFLLALPLIVAVIQGSEVHLWLMGGLRALLYCLLVLAIYLFLDIFKFGWVLALFLLPLFKLSPQGYIGNTCDWLCPEHVTASAYLLLMLGLYAWGYWVFRPKKDRQLPVLLYLLLLLSLICLLLGGASFFVDLYRIPLVPILLTLSLAFYWLYKTDHSYELLPGSPSKTVSIDTALRARLGQLETPKIIAVCTAGGGIQASAWTARVLTGLQEELGDVFSKSIVFMSSVSGGSVGLMHTLDYMDNGVIANTQAVMNSATSNSLDAIGWGLIYPDLWRVSGLSFLLKNKLLDRGLALEQDWQANMRHPERTFSDWQTRMLEGNLPITVFNATFTEDGKRFLLTPFLLENDAESQDFLEVHPDSDIKVATAARLSATFPYVTPSSRGPNKSDKHVADGGYFDNFGVYSTLEFLENHILKKDIAVNSMLILEIRAFPEPQKVEASFATGWRMQFFGPLITLFSVRRATQLSRNLAEIRALQKAYPNRNIRHITLSFPDIEMREFLDEKGRYSPPLSWKLSEKEKSAIERAWSDLKEWHEIKDIKAFLGIAI